METKNDSVNFKRRAELRKRMLLMIKKPVVIETHGGAGAMFQQCYRAIDRGAVFDSHADKCDMLALQRPTWSVYECDAAKAIKLGAGSHLEVNFVDIDPAGECWPFIDAYFSSPREFPQRLAIAVSCGLRQKLRLAGGWKTPSMAEAVLDRGNRSLFKDYLEVCFTLLRKKAWKQGYSLKEWTGYYTSHLAEDANQMTHFGAILEKQEAKL